jgi:hypothetical protein
MRTYYYHSGRSAFAALFLGLLALGAGKLWYNGGGGAMLAFALVMSIGTAKIAFNAMSHDPALKFDRHSIWIGKAWGGLVEVPWRDVHDVAAKVFTMRYMGIIPVSRTAQITVTCEGGVLGARRLRVSASAMGLSVAEAAELVLILKKAQVDAVGEAGAAMAAAGRHGWGVEPSTPPVEPKESSAFDPDAALARYLASKQADAQTQTEPAAAAGRRPHPQRPVFGRRVG